MYLSYNWLQDLVELPKSATPQQLGNDLTMHTVEIEGLESQAEKFEKIVVGKVKEVNAHPNADKLSLAQVDVGEEESRRIVCGAPNLEQGQLVAVALPGAVLPNDIVIEEAEVRGEKSFGMICAEDELDLGEDRSGIMVLAGEAEPGQKLSDYLEVKDSVLEVDNKSLTNRPDLLGYVGLSREIACFYNVNNTSLFHNILNLNLDKSASGDPKVQVDDSALCPRYMALRVDNIKVEESPEWMQKRLTAAGVRPINNIVDVTNYVMLELGQPLHAFDAGVISEIGVRTAKKGEEITTLDGEKRELEEGTLVITDGEKPVAVAGVMGGENSEISSETVSIILESANFDSVSVRKTSQNLGLRTESSMRFEKSLDPYLAEMALARVRELITQICPQAEPASEAVDVYDEEKEDFGLAREPITLDWSWLFQRIGQEIDKKEVFRILEGLGFTVEEKEEEITLHIPSWRATKDISIKEDILEEVGRIYGYENIESLPPRVALESPIGNKKRDLERKIKNILSTGLAMTEVYNYSFVGDEKIEKMGMKKEGYVELANPIASHQNLLRQNLITNLLDNIKLNQPSYDRISLFEVGNIYINTEGETNKDDQSKEVLPYEEKKVGIVEAGDDKEEMFALVKGKVENLLDQLGIAGEYIPAETEPAWSEDGVFARIRSGERILGKVAVVDSKVLKNLGIKKQVATAELSFPELFEAVSEAPKKQYEPLNKYPATVRDLAFAVKTEILYNDIKQEIENFNDLIKKVELFDIYQGEKLGQGKKSLAFHVTYESPNRTLKAEEVEEIQNKLISHLQDKFEARIRDF